MAFPRSCAHARAAAIVVLVACGSGSATPVKRDGAVDVDAGKLFETLCAPCHGADAKGYKADHAPSLVNQTFLESASDEFIRRGIIYGRPGTAMPAYGHEAGGPLDATQINRIVGWLRSQGPTAQPLPPAGAGDVTRGQPIYEKNCKPCHGDRDTRGEGIWLANARLLDAVTDGFLRYAVIKGRPGTRMEAWGGKLSDQDIDDVLAYLHSLGRPPDLGLLPAPTGKEPIVINPDGKDPKLTLHNGPDAKDDRFVPAAQVKQALDDKRRIVIVDARPASDWMRVHIPGAVSIPYLDMHRLDEVPKDVWVVAYCACPHHLSGVVVDELKKRGHTRAAVLDEGILEWHRRGYPVDAAPGVKPPPKEPVQPPGVIP